jgi:hypothetical protein
VGKEILGDAVEEPDFESSNNCAGHLASAFWCLIRGMLLVKGLNKVREGENAEGSVEMGSELTNLEAMIVEGRIKVADLGLNL